MPLLRPNSRGPARIGIDKPALVQEIPQEKWSGQVMPIDDTCAVDGEVFFIRGVLVISVEGAENGLGFGVWISQKQENFQDYVDNSDSADIGQYFGWLTTTIRPSAPILGLKTMAWF